jgi:hypothetical protein
VRQAVEGQIPPTGLNHHVYAEGHVPMDENEVNHLNNPHVVERAPSPEVQNGRRTREPTEVDHLNSQVWQRRPLNGAHYMTPPRDNSIL